MPATRRRAPRRRTYHHGNLRAALVAAAVELLEAEGPLGVSLRGAARRAGVSQAAPYRHFRDKGALLAAVAEQGFRDMAAAGARAAEQYPDDPARALRAMAAAWVRFVADHPSHYRLMLGPSVRGRDHPSLRASAGAAWTGLVGAVASCQRAGRVKAGDPMPLAFALWCLVHGLATLIADEQIPPAVRAAFSPALLAEHNMDLLLEGLSRRS